MKSYKDIKAKVLWNWDNERNPGCSFLPGDRVRIYCSYAGNKKLNVKINSKEVGTVIAVSSGSPGKIRGTYKRMFTRYFVEFNDGQVFGEHSHFMRKVATPEWSA